MADLFVLGVAPIDYSPILLLMPFGFQIAPDTLPSGTRATGSRSALAVSGFRLRARLGFSIPPCFPGQRGITPAFGYGAPHPSAEGTSTPLTHALPSTHCGPSRHPLVFGRLPGFAGYTAYLAPAIVSPGRGGLLQLLSMSLSLCCRFHPAEVNSRIGQFSAGHSAFALRLQARPSGILTFEATMRSLLLRPSDS